MARRRQKANPARVRASVAALDTQGQAPPVAAWRRHLGRPTSLLAATVLSSLLLLIGFAPFDHWAVAYVALVPACLVAVGAERGRWAMLAVYLGGVVFWAAGAYWLSWITPVGYVALALYMGTYWLAAGALLRKARTRGVPMWAALPVVWVALEFARAYLLSGFPWFLLAHSQYRCIRLIQITDLTGQYGVSFLVAMVNGAVVDVLMLPAADRSRRLRLLKLAIAPGAAVCLAAAGGVLGYGAWRLGQQTTRTRPGPTIGVVQMAFPISLGHQESARDVFAAHADNSLALIGRGCDLVVWPESMLGSPAEGELHRLVRRLRCPLLAGGAAPARDPRAREDGITCNSALLIGTDGLLAGRYDKMHLVPFSEYVPFANPDSGLHWFHRLVRRLVPEVMPQLEPGRAPVRFEISSRGETFSVVVPICYEGCFPRVCRRLVMSNGEKAADVLVNISNDGWFIFGPADDAHPSTELDQHLVQYVFRAVETRTPLVRAVNTGISAHVDSSGRILRVVERFGRRKMITGRLIAETLVDDRVTVYSLAGDVFALIVCAVAGLGALAAWWPRRAGKKEDEKA